MFKRKLKIELQEKLRKERMFVTQKIDKATGMILKTIFPNREAYHSHLEHLNTSDHDSQNSSNRIHHHNEVKTYIGDVDLNI
jgi:hypothetical protein